MPPDERRNSSNTQEASDDEPRSDLHAASTATPATMGRGGARAGAAPALRESDTLGRRQSRRLAAAHQLAPNARRGAHRPGRLSKPDGYTDEYVSQTQAASERR